MHLHLAVAPRVQDPTGPAWPLAGLDAALLAWLALEGPTPRARLAQLLWPDKDADAARNSLRQRLFQLRKAVGRELVAGSVTLSLAGGIGHDLEDADTVLGEAAGEDIAPGEFAHWLEQQRARRRDRVRRSIAELCDMAAAAKDWDDALGHASELLALEPLSEEAHRRVMRLHYIAGDHAAALLAFDRCERMLKDDVGAQPSAETLALLASIDSAALPSSDSRPQALPATLLRPPRDTGRDAQRTALLAAWSAAQPFLLLGEPGVGKSRLLESVAAAWAAVLVVRSRPGDLAVPLALVSRLVELLCQRRPSWAQAAGVDALRQQLGAGTAAWQAPPQRPAPKSLSPALQALLALAADDEPPLALLFDDWQFADDASVDLLEDVLASPRLGALRFGHASRTSAGELAERRIAALRQRSERLVVTLAPLELPAVTEFVASLQLRGVDVPGLAQVLVKRVGGSPLYMLEALRDIVERRLPLQPDRVRAPAHVKELVAARLAQLPDVARQLLRLAAVAGGDFSVGLAEAVTGRHLLDLTDAWYRLQTMGLFDDRGIAHDLYSEAALESLPAPISQALHARVAAWLEERPHEAARVAAHWLAAGDPRRAVSHQLAAARQAWLAARAGETFDFFRQAAMTELAQGHPDEAFDHWFDNADAMAEIGSPSQMMQCAEALALVARNDVQQLRVRFVHAAQQAAHGQAEVGSAVLCALLGDAIALGDRRIECECRFAIARCATADGRFDEALQHLAAGERLLRDAGDLRRAAALAASMAMVLGARGQPRLSIREHERVLPLLLQEGDHATWTVGCAAKALQHARQGDAPAALAEAKRAIASVERVSIAPPDTLLAMRSVVTALRWTGRFDLALRACDDFTTRLALHGDYPGTRAVAAALYLHLGRVDLARPPPFVGGDEADTGLRERFRHQLLVCQVSSFAAPASNVDWPLEALACEDLALAAEWALMSGLRAASPWPAAALEALALRCRQAGMSLFARPLGALVALRLLQVGEHGRASTWLDGMCDADALHRLHAATPWAALFGAQALRQDGRADAALALAKIGADWLYRVCGEAIPQAFRDSFLHRNPVNRELLALVARLEQAGAP